MLNQLTTSFVNRLRSNDQAAWFELWETFGPVVRAQLTKWGKGRIGSETARDLSQETLAALSESIDRYDPRRGARFSTWLLAIAKHVLGDEMDRRTARKRGGNRKPTSLEDAWMAASSIEQPDEAYEAAVFRAKVERAILMVEKESEFVDFSIFRSRVMEGRGGKEVAESLGISEPTVSRRLAKVRSALRKRIVEVVGTYSFTEDEITEADRNGLKTKGEETDFSAADDAMFDEAIGEIYHKQMELRQKDRELTAEGR
jgi:hypothetical protein